MERLARISRVTVEALGYEVFRRVDVAETALILTQTAHDVFGTGLFVLAIDFPCGSRAVHV